MNAPTNRAERMAEMSAQGLTLQKIGDHFGVTRERVRQILTKIGAHTRRKELMQRRAQERKEQVKRIRAARALAKWGVEPDSIKEWRANGTLRAYMSQRACARSRGIAWGLTFADWLSIWIASGKLHLRGIGRGHYCMSRINDDGGYVLGNVHVQLATDNSRDAVQKWVGKTKEHRGVFCLYPGRERPWLAKAGKVRLGYFASAEEAAAAREDYIVAKLAAEAQAA